MSHIIGKLREHVIQDVKEHEELDFDIKVIAHQRYEESQRLKLWIAMTFLILIEFRKMNTL